MGSVWCLGTLSRTQGPMSLDGKLTPPSPRPDPELMVFRHLHSSSKAPLLFAGLGILSRVFLVYGAAVTHVSERW